jgi:hypothetical protein
MVELVNKSFICYNPYEVVHIREYYMYCVSLIKQFLLNNELKINVIVGNYICNFNNIYPTLKIGIQCEHTIVKQGGRSVQDVVFGTIQHKEGVYLIRIDNFEYYNELDFVIEYSLPNITNISTNHVFDDYLKKVLYISPTLYPIDLDFKERHRIINMFTIPEDVQDRRIKFINLLDENSITYDMVTDCFNRECLLNLYRETKILLNVHQTEHHHTFEELRVLPALMNGVIIISEETPLKEKIPYSDYIIWSEFEEIPSKIKEVSENYEYYHKKLFNDGNLKRILDKMIKNNILYIERLKNENSITNLRLPS